MTTRSSYHVRTSYKAYRALASLSFPFVHLFKNLSDKHFAGWIVHSNIPWRESVDGDRSLRMLSAQLKLSIAAETLVPYLNWKELDEVYHNTGVAELNRVMEREAERYGVRLFD